MALLSWLPRNKKKFSGYLWASITWACKLIEDRWFRRFGCRGLRSRLKAGSWIRGGSRRTRTSAAGRRTGRGCRLLTNNTADFDGTLEFQQDGLFLEDLHAFDAEGADPLLFNSTRTPEGWRSCRASGCAGLPASRWSCLARNLSPFINIIWRKRGCIRTTSRTSRLWRPSFWSTSFRQFSALAPREGGDRRGAAVRGRAAGRLHRGVPLRATPGAQGVHRLDPAQAALREVNIKYWESWRTTTPDTTSASPSTSRCSSSWVWSTSSATLIWTASSTRWPSSVRS